LLAIAEDQLDGRNPRSLALEVRLSIDLTMEVIEL